jgi:hypothetical protein
LKRLFLFSIGGTGSRIVRSLAHLLAAGVELKATDGKEPLELVPVLIDTDATNNDTLACVSLLELYQTLHRQRDPEMKGGFFATPVTRLSEIADNESGDISTTFRSSYQSVANSTFRKFISFDEITDQPTKYLLEALYSPENFNEELTGGFLGNPNVGAAVLAAFKDSSDFHLFARIFRKEDRIVILNSIFGGTGAAGLPWLLKWLRSSSQIKGATEFISHAMIGAVTVLPYFRLQDSATSRIDSSSFITKTKAALSYYGLHLKKANALYYVGDTVQATYPNHESGNDQANPAHLVEFVAALAIFDFARKGNEELAQGNTYEFALSDDVTRVHLATLGRTLENQIGPPLGQMQILSILARRHLLDAGHQAWAKMNELGTMFRSQTYGDGLGTYLNAFFDPWIRQLGDNERSFAPFDLQTGDGDMSRLIAGRPPARKGWLGRTVNAEYFDTQVNGFKGPLAGTTGQMSRFLAIAWHGTQKMINRLMQ